MPPGMQTYHCQYINSILWKHRHEPRTPESVTEWKLFPSTIPFEQFLWSWDVFLKLFETQFGTIFHLSVICLFYRREIDSAATAAVLHPISAPVLQTILFPADKDKDKDKDKDIDKEATSYFCHHNRK